MKKDNLQSSTVQNQTENLAKAPLFQLLNIHLLHDPTKKVQAFVSIRVAFVILYSIEIVKGDSGLYVRCPTNDKGSRSFSYFKFEGELRGRLSDFLIKEYQKARAADELQRSQSSYDSSADPGDMRNFLTDYDIPF